VTEDLSAIDPSLAALLGGVIDPAGVMIAGIGPPQIPATGIPPLDGINDPWRPIDQDGDWVSQFYAVTWEAGGELPTEITGPADGYSWYVPGLSMVDNLTPTWEEYLASPPNSGEVAPAVLTNYTFADDGTGILGLGFYDATDPPDSDIDLADYIGDGVTIIEPYEFPAPSEAVAIPGPDGAYYTDLTDLSTPVFYGPKTDGDWGEGG
jgi:hypothetical protein